MDIGKLLKNINNLNKYISITHDASEKCRSSKIQLNMSSVLALKKIRSFEIEYVNKCEENGIACVIFERMLNLPPSKTWGVLSKEMVNLLQYWLDAVRKHLVKHSPCWWTFLKLLLKFVKDIRLKDSSIPNILVEYTAECLLDLATTEGPDAMQRYEILHCFNMYCSESSREIRFALRTKLGQYFIKLSTYMCTCGLLPTQYSIMESLLRWLLPRQDRTLRITSANKWFPATLYSDDVVDIFLNRPWMNFFQDARDFLNAHNVKRDLITSVVCRKLSVGDIDIISNTEKTDSYLDINTASKCISVLLDPRVLDAFGSTNHKSFETFVVTVDNTHSVKLSCESQILTLSIETINPPSVLPSCIKLGNNMSCDVTAVLSSRCDLKRLDHALRKIFEDKYQLLLDLEKALTLSPPKEAQHSNKNTQLVSIDTCWVDYEAGDTLWTLKPSDGGWERGAEANLHNIHMEERVYRLVEIKMEDVERFSHPVEVKRRNRSGYIVRTRPPQSCMSPSSVSTSSLAQLHEKLAALPRYKFDKEPQSVCALPELSIVSEVSETDERSSVITLKYKPYGVCHKNQNKLDCTRKSQSDHEVNTKSTRSKIKVVKGRCLSPLVQEDTPSCLLVATVGSTEDTVLNETVERLSKAKDYNPDNIVDLLVQEALNAQLEKDKDSGIVTGDKRSLDVTENCDAIENTPEDSGNSRKTKKRPKIISSTSDESNTEAINDTPNVYVTNRQKKKNLAKVDATERQSFDIQVVEEFFTQHFYENKEGKIAISPTLAKKINETSSESDQFDNNLVLEEDDLRDVEPFDFNKIEVIECLNSMIDRVCDDFDKCTKYLKDQDMSVANNQPDTEDEIPLKYIKDKRTHIVSSNEKPDIVPVSPKKAKLNFDDEQEKKAQVIIKRYMLEVGNTTITMQPKKTTAVVVNDNEIAKENTDVDVHENVETNKKRVSNDSVTKTPVMKKKRKLFSPKDEQIADDAPACLEAEETSLTNSNIKKTPLSTAIYKPYKDIEIERQKHIRLPRNRRSRQIEVQSPRSKKLNDLFEKVKESANGEQVKLVEKASAAYNFSSDSENDFKQKNIEISKKTSNTTLDSGEITVSKRGRVRKLKKYTLQNESKIVKNKTNTRRKPKKQINIEPMMDLVDERMRSATVVIDKSVAINKPQIVVSEPEFVAAKPAEMEAITETHEKSNKSSKAKQNKKTKGKINLEKEMKKPLKSKPNAEDDRTESPLPGLVVEEDLTVNNEDGDLSANVINKLKKIIHNHEGSINESNTTQNLLSDNEKVNSILPNNINEIVNSSPLNIINENVNFSPPNIINETLNSSPLNITNKNMNSIPPNIINEIVNSSPLNIINEKNNFSPPNNINENASSSSPDIISKENPQSEQDKPKDGPYQYTRKISHHPLNPKVFIIELRADTENISEYSIPTVGINGHGDSREAPPSPKSITERYQPRNLETEYMNNSTKDYYNKLTQEINDINHNESIESLSSPTSNMKNQNADTNIFSKSPVVSLKRLSHDDISKWMPSSPNSDSDEYFTTLAKSKRSYKADVRRVLTPKKVSTPKKVPMPKKVSTPKKISTPKIVLTPIKVVRKPDVDSETDTGAEQVKTFKKSIKKSRGRPRRHESDTDNGKNYGKRAKKTKNVRNQPSRQVKRSQRSIISPIKMYEGSMPIDGILSQSTPFSNDDTVDIERAIQSPIIKTRLPSKGSIKEKTLAKLNEIILGINAEHTSESVQSKIDNLNTSTRKEDSRTVESRVEDEIADLIGQYVEENNNTGDSFSYSAFTASTNVDDWFKGIEPSSGQSKDINVSIMEGINNVFEKLDTTLLEIHQNTSNKFVKLFVGVQKKFDELKATREKLYQVTAADIVSAVIRVVDDKFSDLDKMAKQQDADIMKQLKEQASTMIREDCKQKKIMVQLLKEDVQAIIRHRMKNKISKINTNTRSSSRRTRDI